jgi:glucokinase
MAKYYIGVDVGGTAIKAVLADSAFNSLITSRIPTEAAKGYEYIAANMMDMLAVMLEKAEACSRDLYGISIGLPGLVDVENGVSLDLKNLKWDHIRIAEHFSGRFNVPVFIDNDGNLNALGEKYLGAGTGVDDFILITLGTGVGAGIISGGELLRGAGNFAGEIGHMIIQKDGAPCSCGSKGCFESYCSAKSIVNAAKQLAAADRASVLWSLTNGDMENLTAEMLHRGFELKDGVCVHVIDRMIEYLGIGLASLIHIFNPARIIIGGGVSGMGEKLLAPLREKVKRRLMNPELQSCGIEAARLGGNAGMMGACILTAKKLGLLCP